MLYTGEDIAAALRSSVMHWYEILGAAQDRLWLIGAAAEPLGAVSAALVQGKAWEIGMHVASNLDGVSGNTSADAVRTVMHR